MPGRIYHSILIAVGSYSFKQNYMRVLREIPVLVLVLLAFFVGGFLLVVTLKSEQQKQEKVDIEITDADANGFPDAGVTVSGEYTSVYSYDNNGNWYWDIGDGRKWGNVLSAADLEQATLTTCNYQVQYSGNFENDPFLDNGWISNDINCSGYNDNGTYNYLIVHTTDSRYRGNGVTVWGLWEYQPLAIPGFGNLARPEKPVGIGI